MNVLLILYILLSLGYAIFLCFVLSIWSKTKTKIESIQDEKISFSIIIPARNEEANIRRCVESVLGSNYPKSKFEVIVIDDHSTDKTYPLIEQIKADNLQLLSLEDFISDSKNAYKKWAIQYGIQKAQYDYILSIDADCVLPKDGLKCLSEQFISEKSMCIAGPIHLTNQGSLLEDFQQLDNMGMMALTQVGIETQAWHLANGANLSFKKSAYFEVNNLEDLDDKASGDDVFLIQKMFKTYPKKIHFAKDKQNIVSTPALQKLSAFNKQRIRWASKNASYSETALNIIMLAIWGYCTLSLIFIFVNPLYALLSIIFKAIVDTFYLSRLSLFFDSSISQIKMFLLSPIHLLYVSIFGLMSLVKPTYLWKGRRVQ